MKSTVTTWIQVMPGIQMVQILQGLYAFDDNFFFNVKILSTSNRIFLYFQGEFTIFDKGISSITPLIQIIY